MDPISINNDQKYISSIFYHGLNKKSKIFFSGWKIGPNKAYIKRRGIQHGMPITKRFVPKDAGHEKSVLQPFSQKKRDWKELEWSTFIMLKVEEMLQSDVKELSFNIETEIDKLI